MMSDKRTYTDKRDFSSTPEPQASEEKGNTEPIFVIQKHDAQSLHYDFRLEIDGTLKSWAIPKGPSTNPSEKRLAVPTEDHPLKYADFEGVIPEGEYGAGTVMIWDTGKIDNLKEGKRSLARSYEEGLIEVFLHGQKLTGGYALVRLNGGPQEGNWLLVKMKDDEADARRNPVSTEPKSVKSGRTLDEIHEKEA